MNIIVKSGKKNWSGKEFSDHPAKIYTTFSEATQAIHSYHFIGVDESGSLYREMDRTGSITFTMLTETRMKKLLSEGKIRW